MDQGIASTLAELQLKIGELERALRTISEPPPAAPASAPVPSRDGIEAHHGRIIDEAFEPRPQEGPAGGPAVVRPAETATPATAPQELLRFRDRLERTARSSRTSTTNCSGA